MIDAFILGVVEGLTEFLPVSSTGHMILSMELLGLKMNTFYQSFLIIIQLGSILAVIISFYKRFFCGIKLYIKLAVAFLPAGIIGFFTYNFLAHLFNGYVVVFMLAFGGLVFIIIEKNYKNKEHKNIDELSYKDAFLIGLGQALAIIPGTSRSGACMIASLLVGLDRKSAVEFSFLLAVPTMIIASLYSLYKNPQILANTQLLPLALGFITAFFVALVVIKLFLKVISKISFIPFGIYRILLALIFLYLFSSGILKLDQI